MSPRSLFTQKITLYLYSHIIIFLSLLIQATKDGWSAINFHNCVDGKGSAIVVALSKSSRKLFGGYNPLGWMSTDDYGNSNAAFLWFQDDNNTGRGAVQKCPILTGGNTAIFDYATSGPNFGASVHRVPR